MAHLHSHTIEPVTQGTQLQLKTVFVGQQHLRPLTRFGIAQRQLAAQLRVQPVGKALADVGRPIHLQPFLGKGSLVGKLGAQRVKPELLAAVQICKPLVVQAPPRRQLLLQLGSQRYQFVQQRVQQGLAALACGQIRFGVGLQKLPQRPHGAALLGAGDE